MYSPNIDGQTISTLPYANIENRYQAIKVVNNGFIQRALLRL